MALTKEVIDEALFSVSTLRRVAVVEHCWRWPHYRRVVRYSTSTVERAWRVGDSMQDYTNKVSFV